LTQPNFVDATLKQGGTSKDTIETVYKFLAEEKPTSFTDCVAWARLKFEELFSNNIRQLLFNFPPDATTSSGQPFWSGPKRAPTPLVFDVNNRAHLDFIIDAANLHAFNYGIKGEESDDYFRKELASIIVPEFKPKEGVKIQVQENENVENDNNGKRLKIGSLKYTNITIIFFFF
jgi:ubiquitin-activating enzyme E1